MIAATLSRSFTASAAGIIVDLEARHRGSPICTLARRLVEAGHDPADKLHVYRGGVLCFRPAPLSMWAGLRVQERDDRSARFSPHREHPAGMADSAARVAPISGVRGSNGGDMLAPVPAVSGARCAA